MSKTRGDLCLKLTKFVAIFDDPVVVRQRFLSVKDQFILFTINDRSTMLKRQVIMDTLSLSVWALQFIFKLILFQNKSCFPDYLNTLKNITRHIFHFTF